MSEIVNILSAKLMQAGVGGEQLQNILSSVNLSQLNLQDLSASQDYLFQFLENYGLDSNLVSGIVNSFFGDQNVLNILNPEILEQGGNLLNNDIGGILGNLGNLGSFFGD